MIAFTDPELNGDDSYYCFHCHKLNRMFEVDSYDKSLFMIHSIYLHPKLIQKIEPNAETQEIAGYIPENIYPL